MPSARSALHAADAQHQLLANARPLVAAVQPAGQLAVLGLLPSTSQSSRYSCTRPTCISQTLANSGPVRVSIATVIGLPSGAEGRLHRQVLDLRVDDTLRCC